MIEGAPQLEAISQLGGDETKQLIAHRAAAEQIRVPAAEAARARAAQPEDPAPVLDQPVHLVKQRRHLLDLIENHQLGSAAREQLFSEELRGLRVADEQVGLQQVDPQCIRIGCQQKGALAGLSGAPKEKTLLWSQRQAQQPF